MTKHLQIADAGVSKAFAEELDHPPPFTLREVRTIRRLGISRARDLGAVTACTALGALTLRASEVTDLSALAGLPELTIIYAKFSALRDISALRELPKLHSVRFIANLIEDISPLAALELRNVTLLGHPLDERSRRLVQQIPDVETDRDEEWKLTRALQARGWDAVFYRDDQSGATAVVRPGLRYGSEPEYDGIPITAAQLRRELARTAVTYDDLIARYRDH
jgi:hypothetical protein